MAHIRHLAAVIAFGALAAIAVTGTAWANGFMYFKDPSIVGEVNVPGLGAGWIQLLSLSPAAPPPGGGTVNFTKRVDKSSPKLFQAAAIGQVFRTVVIAVPIRGTRDFKQYQLKSAIIGSFSVVGDGDAAVDHISISYADLE